MDESGKLEPRVWVGCLACYTAGRLVGVWLDGDEADDRNAFEAGVAYSRTIGTAGDHSLDHEELWIMDHEGFGGLLKGECSPSEAQKVAEAIERIQDAGWPIEAVAAYREYVGPEHFDLDDLSEFEESYAGEWESGTDFAYYLATEMDYLDLASWPNTCIDWERAAEELFMGDFWSAKAPGGRIYVFRAV